MGREAVPGAAPGEASSGGAVGSRRAEHAGKPSPPSPGAKPGSRPRRASLGGRPAQDRELRAQGRQTLRNLLEAGLAEFDERGFQAVRVDDIVRRAQISHGTFYLYFSNKEDLFKALLSDALHDMGLVTDEFPVVTRNEAGQAAIVGEEVWGDGLKLLFRLAEAMAQGMTAATGAAEHAELTAVACLMMLERVNYLMSVEVMLPRDEMVERITAIMFASFGAL